VFAGRSREVFTGRSRELAALASAVTAARASRPALVLVEGEAGMGKSALLSRFASRLSGETVLRASGEEAEILLPYGIVGQLAPTCRHSDRPRREWPRPG
jgi:AAA ATPase domain